MKKATTREPARPMIAPVSALAVDVEKLIASVNS